MLNIVNITKSYNSRKNTLEINRTFGSQIKYHRIKQNLTLEEACAGICSTSSLSKAENSIIELSEAHKQALCQKMNLTFNEDTGIQAAKEFNQAIDQYFDTGKYNHPKSDSDTPQDSLLYLFSLVLSGNYNVPAPVQAITKSFMKIYNDDEAALFLYSVAKLFEGKGQYREAHNLLLEIKTNLVTNPKLLVLIQKELLKTAMIIRRSIFVERNFKTIIESISERGYFEHARELKALQLQYFSTDISPIKTVKEVPQLFYTESDGSNLTLAISNFYHEDYQNCLDCLNKVINTNLIAYQVMMLITLDRLKDKERLTKIIETNTLNCQHKNVKQISEYLTVKYSKGREGIIKFLRSTIFNDKQLTDSFIVLNYWLEEVTNTFGQQALYKEVVYFTRKVNKIKRRATRY